MTELRTKVYDILNGFSTAMMVTAGAGKLASRPMPVAAVEQDGGPIWFFAGKHGMVAEEIAKEPQVLLIFQDEHSAYLSVRGNAKVVDDRPRILKLWKEPYKAWFPRGAEDPDISFIAV